MDNVQIINGRKWSLQVETMRLHHSAKIGIKVTDYIHGHKSSVTTTMGDDATIEEIGHYIGSVADAFAEIRKLMAPAYAARVPA